MKYFLFATLALTLGYSSEWVADFVRFTNASGQLIVLGNLDQYRTDCMSPRRDRSVCTDEYVIPKQTLLKTDLNVQELGLGTIMLASEIYCHTSDGLNLIKTYDDPSDPGKLFDTRNVYQTVTLSPQKRCESIVVRAWAKPDSRRKGYIGGKATVGSSLLVHQVRRMHEFYNSGIRVIVCFIVLFTFVITTLLRSRIRNSTAEDPFDRYHWAWIMFLLFSSGFLQIIFPVMHPTFFGMAAAFFSLVCHFLPSIAIIAGSANSNTEIYQQKYWKRFEMGAYAAISLYILMPFFITIYAPLNLSLSILTFAGGALLKRPALLFYGVVQILNSLKLMNVPAMPHPHVASLFVACIFVNNAVLRVRMLSKLSNSLNWAQEVIANSNQIRNFGRILEYISQQTGSHRVTFIELLEEGECQIFIGKKVEEEFRVETFTRQEIPKIIAHSITVNENLWHLSEDSEMYKSIKTYQNPKNSEFKSKFFTVIPMSDSEEVVGVLALTDYQYEIVQPGNKNFEFQAIIELIKPYLAQISSVRKRERRLHITTNETRISDLLTSLRSQLDSNFSSTEIYQKLLDDIYEVTGYSAFFGTITANKLVVVHAVSGYTEQSAKQIREGRIVIDDKNKQGPLPLAVSNRKTIIIPDFKKIGHVMNPISSELIKRNKSTSGAAIPVLDTTGDKSLFRDSETTVRGIIWLEAKELNNITFSSKPLLEAIKQTFENLIFIQENQNQINRSRSVMNQLMPQWVTERLMKGETAQEIDTGYLVMIDAKNSTKIAEAHGQSAWSKFVNDALKPEVESLAKQFGLDLHVIIWDAFYLTISCRVKDREVENMIRSFCHQTTKEFNRLYKQEFSRFKPPVGDALRICVVFGETTRGFSPPPNSTWTVVGSAMAHVSKLESCVKEVPGTIFVAERSFLAIQDDWLIEAEAFLDYTGEKIYTDELFLNGIVEEAG